MKILLVEDDVSLRDAVATVLKEECFDVDEAGDGEEGLYLAEQEIYDLIILDVMLPEMNGFDLTQKFRMRKYTAPILFLTARDALEDRVRGLDVGGDDYMMKPFAVQELLARMRALLRRRYPSYNGSDHVYGRVTAKRSMMEGFVDDEPLNLKVKEYEMLEYFVINQELILTKEQIFDRIWGWDSDVHLGIVDVYLHFLRKKLAPYGCDSYIQTVRGVGYMFREKPNV